MSTLTKILIVLLTISSIFLCGIVVTYVANADNYRDKYDMTKTERDSLRESEKSLKEQLNNKIAETTDNEIKLNSEISSLKKQVSTLKGQLEDAQRTNASLILKTDRFATDVENFTKTNENLTSLLNDHTKRWKSVETDLIKEQSQHKETAEILREKLAIIQALETDKKRLIEEKTELQARMDKLLQPVGKTTAPVVTITQEKEIARPTPMVTEKIALKGLITAVDLKNKLASISIGTADGVKEGMKFHITRVDEAICDILIIDADTEQSVGALELLDLTRAQPKAGDTVTTNL